MNYVVGECHYGLHCNLGQCVIRSFVFDGH